MGSSDAPIVMSVSPWSTPFQLWQQKCNLVPKKVFSNWAIDRGNNLEPVARAKYELETGIDMPATLAIHPQYTWLRASLDGYNSERDIVLEIKCPGKDDHQTALDGKVPEKYYPQLQHQLMVTGSKEAHYYSFDGNNGALVVVKPDLDYCKELFKREQAFWECIQTKTPPEFTDKDVKVIKSVDAHDLARSYLSIVEKQAELDVQLSEIKAKLLTFVEKHPKILIGKLQITKSYRQGSVDYKAIPELDGVDLDKHRKPASECVTIRELK